MASAVAAVVSPLGYVGNKGRLSGDPSVIVASAMAAPWFGSGGLALAAAAFSSRGGSTTLVRAPLPAPATRVGVASLLGALVVSSRCQGSRVNTLVRPLGFDDGGAWRHHPLEGVVMEPRYHSVAAGCRYRDHWVHAPNCARATIASLSGGTSEALRQPDHHPG